MVRWLRTIGVVIALLVLAAQAAPLALADATPVQLVLTYMANVSNTGQDKASGIAELVLPEGEVRIEATHLDHLEGDARYVAWVLNSETNQFQRVGAFNAEEPTDAVHYENVLPDAIPNKHWNLLLLTVEDKAEPGQPSKKHSIAGVFPRSENEPPPAMLPNTGGADPDDLPLSSRPDWLAMAGLAALTGSAGLGAGYVLGLRKK